MPETRRSFSAAKGRHLPQTRRFTRAEGRSTISGAELRTSLIAAIGHDETFTASKSNTR